MALYRTYRPSRLSEVIGQDHVTEPLARALGEGRIHHAYLFSGPRGCGKTSTARILARSMLCERGPTPDPCGHCHICIALAPNGPGLVDVIELDAASHGGVDDTRDLRERAAFVPAQARFKVYIIDEAHMVSKDGFNALLKLIEEPPEHVKFIFATTEVDKVLPTIRSRTFNYAFRLVPVRQLQDNLAMICDAEGVAADPNALTLIARASGGSVRDAQSIMGQLIAGAGPEGLTQASVADQLGVTDDALLDTAVSAIADHDGSALFGAVESVVESGHDVRRFVTDLLHRFRDLLVIHHAGDSATADVLDVSQDRREVLAGQAGRFGPTELTRYAQIVNDGLTHVKGSTSPRLQLEILAARLLVPATEVDAESTLSRIDVLERRMSILASAPPGGTAAPASSAAAAPGSSHGTSPQAGASLPETTASASAAGAASATPDAAPHTGARTAQPTGPAAASGRTAGPPPKPRLSSVSTSTTEAPAATRGPTPDPGRSGGGARPHTGTAAPAAARASHAASPPSAAHAHPAQSPDAVQGGGAGADRIARIRHLWPELLTKVQARSRVAAASWDGSRPLAVTAGVLAVEVPSAGQAKSIANSGRDIMVRTILIEDYGIDVQVRAQEPAVAGAGPPDSEPSDSDPDLADSGLVGVDLLRERLGATTIGEIEGS
jgi:DNA polymerase-3 subunit gamma/tau